MTGAPVMSSTDDVTGGAPAGADAGGTDPETVHALIRLTDLFTPSAVRAGATHGVFSALAAGHDRTGIAARGGLDAEFLGILLDFYEEVGLTERTGDTVGLTALGAALAEAEPALTMRGMFGQTARSMIGMDHTLATGQIATAGVFGTDFWTALSATDPDESVIAREMSAAGVDDYDSDLVRDCIDWSGVDHVVDLGGGRGDLLVKLLEAVPEARGTVIEYGHMVAVARAHLASSLVARRAEARPGSYLEQITLRADVFVLSGILADWHDDDAVAILRRARDAAAESNGRVVLAEIALRGQSARERLYYRMIVSRPTREADELTALARRAGFATVSLRGESSRRIVLELTP